MNVKFDNIEIEKETLRKMNKSSRRNAVKKHGGQDKFSPKIEKVKKRYNRKPKYKDDYSDYEQED